MEFGVLIAYHVEIAYHVDILLLYVQFCSASELPQ